jgi:hypothetical protein
MSFDALATVLDPDVPPSQRSGDKEKPPPPWFDSWNGLEARIQVIDKAEPAVLCVTVRATGRVFWSSLAGVARKHLEFTLLSSDQFEKVDGKWVLAEEIDIQFRISKHLPLPADLPGGSIEINAENLIIVIHPYGTETVPGYSRR